MQTLYLVILLLGVYSETRTDTGPRKYILYVCGYGAKLIELYAERWDEERWRRPNVDNYGHTEDEKERKAAVGR